MSPEMPIKIKETELKIESPSPELKRSKFHRIGAVKKPQSFNVTSQGSSTTGNQLATLVVSPK
jgi:hypothetical protein